jgi:hypothetical protein
MNSRADGLNVHGGVDGFTLQNSHIENSGDDCIGIWSTEAHNVTIRNMTAVNCAVTAGVQGNWGSCMGTYAFKSLAVRGLACYDPFPLMPAAGCNPRTHFTAIHLNHAFAKDCMPTGASLSLSGVEYFASSPGQQQQQHHHQQQRQRQQQRQQQQQQPDLEALVPLPRPKCGQCRSCCGSCSYAGFDKLAIEYLDGTVPAGSCMEENAGC